MECSPVERGWPGGRLGVRYEMCALPVTTIGVGESGTPPAR